MLLHNHYHGLVFLMLRPCFCIIDQGTRGIRRIPWFKYIFKLNLCVRKPTIWVPTRSNTNRLYSHRRWLEARNFGFRKQTKVEELYYTCSENNGADQRLCFRLCKLLIFPCGGSIKRKRIQLLNHFFCQKPAMFVAYHAK